MLNGRRVVAIVVVLGAIVSAFAVHRGALGDFRRVEAIYVRSRQPSSCVIRELAKRIDDRNPRPELITNDLPAFIGHAAIDVRHEQEAIAATSVGPYPGLHDARDAVARSTQASVQFYDAILLTPNESNDELTRFRSGVREAEDALGNARRWLLIRPGRGWSARTDCPT